MGAPWLSTRGLRRPGSDGAFYRKHPNDGEIIVGRGRRVCKGEIVILFIVNKFKSTYGILAAVKMYFVLKGLKDLTRRESYVNLCFVYCFEVKAVSINMFEYFTFMFTGRTRCAQGG